MPPPSHSSGAGANGNGAVGERTIELERCMPTSSPPRRCLQLDRLLSRWIEEKRRSRAVPVLSGTARNLVSTSDVTPQSRSEVETNGENGTYSMIDMALKHPKLL